MNVTVKGLRTALDKVCLYLIPLLVIGIPFTLLMSTDNDGKVRLLPNLIPLILTFGIMAGTVAAAYLIIGVALSFMSTEPVSDQAMSWAQAHTRDERSKQLNRLYLALFVRLIVFSGIGLILITIAATASEAGEAPLAAIAGTIGRVLIVWAAFVGVRSLKRVGELEYADALLRRAEKKAKKAAA